MICEFHDLAPVGAREVFRKIAGGNRRFSSALARRTSSLVPSVPARAADLAAAKRQCRIEDAFLLSPASSPPFSGGSLKEADLKNGDVVFLTELLRGSGDREC